MLLCNNNICVILCNLCLVYRESLWIKSYLMSLMLKILPRKLLKLYVQKSNLYKVGSAKTCMLRNDGCNVYNNHCNILILPSLFLVVENEVMWGTYRQLNSSKEPIGKDMQNMKYSNTERMEGREIRKDVKGNCLL